MLQIKITISEEEHSLLQARANRNLNSLSREARLILRHILYNEIPTPASSDPTRIAGIPFPAFPDYKITSTTTSTTVPTPHAYSNITPPGVQSTTLEITPDPNAGSINIPYIDVASIKDYRQPQPKITESEQIAGPGVEDTPVKSRSYKNNIQPTLTDLEIEQVDNEWDSEGNEYSTEDFMVDLRNLEEKLREDVPADQDPTQDPDYIAIKKYFIKHDLRERFRSLLSDPSRFYPEEGVYDPPQIRYIRAAFRKEKIDEDYIVALLSGTGADYRRTHKSRLYVDEQ